MMYTRKATGFVVLVLLVSLALALLVPVALAQSMSFNVRDEKVDLYINHDGTVQIIYDMTLVADPGSAHIDYVDVGMPNSSYSLSDIQASVVGVPLTDISASPYVKPGVAVGLGSQTIQPGQTGTLRLEATVRDLLYQDSKDPEYASIEFAPNWFDSKFVHGVTRLEVNLHFPTGVTSEEPRYHDQPFTSAAFENDRPVYTWINDNASGSQKYVFGASFPKKYLAEGVVQSPPAFNLNLGAICGSPFCWFGLFGLGWAFLAVVGNRSQKRRKMDYLPPSLAVEGTGLKRGLTAVEAAVLLEAPLNKVLTMILFALVKKGLVTVESEKPLKVTAVQQVPKDTALWNYEESFLGAIKADGTLDEGQLHELVIALIGDVNKKLSAFNRKETEEYYKDIAARAWQQVEAADTPQVLGERWSDGLEWTMLDDNWDNRTRRVFQDRPVVLPGWWWGYRPWVASAGSPARPSAPMPSPGGGGIPVTLPTLPGADFANTVVRGVENAANTVVGSIEGFTGKIVQKTNPPPKPSTSTSSRSSSGGHSCACACACAGCACACAGGGR